MPGDPIDTVLAELGRALRGPKRARGDLLAEVRDGLLDAAHRYQDTGLDRDDARRRAAEDFGDVRELVPAYRAELIAGQGRRTALVMLLGLPPLTQLWAVLPRNAPPRPDRLGWLYHLYQGAAAVSVCAAVCGLALLVVSARNGRSPGVVVLGLAVATGVAVLMNLSATTISAVAFRSPVDVVARSPLTALVYLVTLLGLALAIRAAWRSFALFFAPPA
ncbi:permease prefix domain 1-containing protein [Pseudonocardia spinosispora]|uniref:permease prefix domain 1-containing protein n=1 Tax=Pseudonocardia spinosispora TaxID=103441 RepID=UPI000426003A|nr:permease prefix domain 1-containing protein [Pseudonocardia spinosispora]